MSQEQDKSDFSPIQSKTSPTAISTEAARRLIELEYLSGESLRPLPKDDEPIDSEDWLDDPSVDY